MPRQVPPPLPGQDPAAVKALLESPEARELAAALQRLGGDGLRQAAQAAAGGDGAALSGILDKVASDPQGARAMERMRKKAER